jgi:hypothetical protein
MSYIKHWKLWNEMRWEHILWIKCKSIRVKFFLNFDTKHNVASCKKDKQKFLENQPQLKCLAITRKVKIFTVQVLIYMLNAMNDLFWCMYLHIPSSFWHLFGNLRGLKLTFALFKYLLLLLFFSFEKSLLFMSFSIFSWK